MSAIIAGKKCSNCGLENYYLSFGHPKWYEDVSKRRREPSLTYKQFLNCRHSGVCPQCWLLFRLDEGAQLEGFVEILFIMENATDD